MLKHSFQLDGAPHWEVDKISRYEHRLFGNRIKTLYLVRWSGFSAEDDTLEPEINLKNCTGPLAIYSESVRLAEGTLDPPDILLNKLKQRRRGEPPVDPPLVFRTTRLGRQTHQAMGFDEYFLLWFFV